MFMTHAQTDNSLQKRWGEFLTRCHIALIGQYERTITVTEFSEILGEDRRRVEKWIAGKSIPSGRSLVNVANRLGPEVYDVLGIPRPILPLGSMTEFARDMIRRMQEIENEDPALVDELQRQAEETIEARRRPAPPPGATGANG